MRSADVAVLNQAFTGAANAMDMTGGRFTPVFASKVPDHRGLAHGHRSVDDGASGGRMGFVTGEDATEVANSPATCQAHNQVRGRLTVLGHPFPVPAGSRLVPLTAEVPTP